MMAFFSKGQIKWLWLSVIVIALDQISKWYAIQNLELHRPVEFFSGFNWMLAYNRGAAFSFLGDADGWQQWLFSGIAIVIVSILLRWMWTMKTTEKMLGIACGLIIGGAIGNLIDRAVQAKVTDFIDWYYGTHHWPTFNLADSFILLGAFLILLEGFLNPQSKKEAE
jgi:signal peptidase II